MKADLSFHDKNAEKSYSDYNSSRRKTVLQMQRGAVGFFSFLGIFHLVYLQPKKKEIAQSTEAYIAVATAGVVFSIVLGVCAKTRSRDWLILMTNLLINFILIEPNFLVIAQTRPLSETKYFWIGFRISSINLITLKCYNSFAYKMLQTMTTIVYLIIRMRDQSSLHNILVDISVGVLVCLFIYNQEKGERTTYLELHRHSVQRESWRQFLNFLPEGIAIFSEHYHCTLLTENMRNIFRISDAEDLTRTMFNLSRTYSEFSETKGNSRSLQKSKQTQRFGEFYSSFEGVSKVEGQLFSQQRKSSNHVLTAANFFDGFYKNCDDIFYSEYDGKYLSIKLTHIKFDDVGSTLVMVSDISQTIRSHILEENRKYRDLLFASFSHEIRTPLNCILLLLGKLTNEPQAISDEVLRANILPSFYSGQILLHLVNDILDFSLLIREELLLSLTEIDVEAECLEILEVICMQAEMKGIQILLKLDCRLPAVVRTDSSRLKQILCHLLLNALRFTYEGSITLKVSPSKREEQGIVFSVKDTGIGMNCEEQMRLKEILKMTSLPSFKVSEHATGASLKTLLTQSLALVLGFSGGAGIFFSSAPKQGTKFSFLLQNHEGPKAGTKEPPRVALAGRQSKTGIKVAWVESEPRSEKIKPSRGDLAERNLDCPLLPFAFRKQNLADVYSVPGSFISQPSQDNIGSECSQPKEAVLEFPLVKRLRTAKVINTNSTMEISTKISSIPQIESFPLNSECSHAQILVVDDDEFNIFAVKAILSKNDYLVSTARNGVQAIALLHEEARKRKNCCQKFQLILMDVNMPLMGGLEATQILKRDMQQKKLPWMPIVGCTAFVNSGDEQLCKDNGMDGYVAKPLNESKLAGLIQKWT